jgi:hypothetical protein
MWRGHRFIEPRPAAIPGLQLRTRQACLDLDHPRAKKIEGALIQLWRPLEVKADLQLPGSCVMPDLVVELGMAEVELDQPAASARAFEAPVGLRQPQSETLPQPAEELDR